MLQSILRILKSGRAPNEDLERTAAQIRELDPKTCNQGLGLAAVRYILYFADLKRMRVDLELQKKQREVDIQKKQNALQLADDKDKDATEKELKAAEAELSKVLLNYNEKIEAIRNETRKDIEQTWAFLENMDKLRPNTAKAAAVLRIDVAQRLSDLGRLKNSLTQLNSHGKGLSLSDHMMIFSTQPYLGRYADTTKLLPQLALKTLHICVTDDEKSLRKVQAQLQQLQKQQQLLTNRLAIRKKELRKYNKNPKLKPDCTSLLQSLHRAAQERATVDLSVIYELVQQHKLEKKGDPSFSSLSWNECRPEKFRVRFKSISCPKGQKNKEKELMEEMKKQPKWDDWEDLPMLEGLVIRKMGGITQVLNYAEEGRISLVGPTLPGRIHVKGSNEMIMERPQPNGADPSSTPGPLGVPVTIGGQRVLLFDPNKTLVMTQEEEWDLVRDAPYSYSGTLIHTETPQVPAGQKPTEDDIPVTQIFDCELLLGKGTEFESMVDDDGIATEIDGLTLS